MRPVQHFLRWSLNSDACRAECWQTYPIRFYFLCFLLPWGLVPGSMTSQLAQHHASKECPPPWLLHPVYIGQGETTVAVGFLYSMKSSCYYLKIIIVEQNPPWKILPTCINILATGGKVLILLDRYVAPILKEKKFDRLWHGRQCCLIRVRFKLALNDALSCI